MGLLDLGGICPQDVFIRVDTVSLSLLAEGTYTVALVGESFTYRDTLHIPTTAPDSLYQFSITVMSRATGEAVPGVPLALYLLSPADTILRDTTDTSGSALFTYSSSLPDSLQYELQQEPGGYFGRTWAKLGIPEVMKLGTNE